MAELNLKQITDRLNTEFTGDTRKLVFWYDDKGEFKEDIDSLVLDNAKALEWLKKGAQPSDTVRSILSHEGILKQYHDEKAAGKAKK